MMTTETTPVAAQAPMPPAPRKSVNTLLVTIGILVLVALAAVALWFYFGSKSGENGVTFRVIENEQTVWYTISPNGSSAMLADAPSWYREATEMLAPTDFSPVVAGNGSVMMLSPNGLETAMSATSRSVLIERRGTEWSSSAVSADASLAVLFNEVTNQFDVFSLDSERPTVLSYEGSVPAPGLFYGVGALPGNRIVIRTTTESFDVYTVKGGVVTRDGALKVKATQSGNTSFLEIPTAHAWTYGTPLTSTGATSAASTRCTGSVISTLGYAGDSGSMPSIQTIAWNYLGAQGTLPADYNNGSYCIQVATAVTYSDSNNNAYNVVPVAHAAGGGGGLTVTGWEATFTIHSGSGTAAAGSRFAALTYAATAVPTATLSSSPTTVDQGSAAILTWSSANAASCTGTGFSTGGLTSGSVSVSPLTTTTYSVTCGAASDSETVTVVTRPNLAASAIAPSSANVVGQTTLSATVTNSGAGPTAGTFYVLFQLAATSAGTNADVIGTYAQTTAVPSGGTVSATRTHDFASTGTWYVRACADKASVSDSGSVSETNESDNCSAWTAVTVGGTGGGTWEHVASDIQDFACPLTDMSKGGHNNMADCSPADPSGTSCTVGDTCKYKYPSGCNMYIETYQCSSAAAPTITASLTANPLSLLLGSSTSLTWSSTGATSCVGTGFATGGATSGTVIESPTSTTQYIINCSAGSGTGASGAWEGDSWWTGGTQTAIYGETVHDNGQQGDLCPNAALNAGYSAWNEQFVRYPNRCGDAGCDLAVITCYGVSGATGTTAKPAEYNGGACISSTAHGCRDTTYRRSSASATGAGTATDSETVTVTRTQCNDGVDNDGDTRIDTADAGCSGDTDDNESDDPGITCNFSSNPSPLVGGAAATFTWSSTNATSCTGTGFSTNGATSGTSGSITATAGGTYELQCTASGLTPCTKLLTASSPVASIVATPERVNAGTNATVEWSAAQVSSCTITKNGSTIAGPTAGPTIASTSLANKITGQSVFVISCDGGAARDQVIVNVIPEFEEF